MGGRGVARELEKNNKTKVEEAVADAQREPLADPNLETWCPYATQTIAEALLVR